MSEWRKTRGQTLIVTLLNTPRSKLEVEMRKHRDKLETEIAQGKPLR